MLEMPVLFSLAKISAVIASYLIADYAKADMVLWVISALSFACVFVLEILLNRTIHKKQLLSITILGSLIACFSIGIEILFPLYIILVVQLFDLTIDKSMYYQILIVAFMLSFFIFPPSKEIFAVSMIMSVMLLFGRVILIRLYALEKINGEHKDTINEMDKKLKDLKGLINTLKTTVSLEERNRIAARLHDQIGHGISGSIIMLEAAMLVMKDYPEKAAGSVQKAITNLREGVDEIRAALREERADRYLLGMNDLTSLVEEFKVSYNKAASIKTTGDLNNISIDIWACIHDNLKECLTNLLKHSNATEFILNIEVFKKMIKVEYKDNGKSIGEFEKDLGLEAIEERTVKAKGRCFITKGERGFCVTNIFPN